MSFKCKLRISHHRMKQVLNKFRIKLRLSCYFSLPAKLLLKTTILQMRFLSINFLGNVDQKGANSSSNSGSLVLLNISCSSNYCDVFLLRNIQQTSQKTGKEATVDHRFCSSKTETWTLIDSSKNEPQNLYLWLLGCISAHGLYRIPVNPLLMFHRYTESNVPVLNKILNLSLRRLTRGPLVLFHSPDSWGYVKISGYWGKEV